MINFLKQNLLKSIIGFCILIVILMILLLPSKDSKTEEKNVRFDTEIQTDYENESFTFEDMLNSNGDSFFGDNEPEEEAPVINPYKNILVEEQVKDTAPLMVPVKKEKPIKKSSKQISKKPSKVAVVVPPKKLTLEERLVLKRTEGISDPINSSNRVQVRAVVNQNQTIYQNGIVTVRLLEDAVSDHLTIPRNTYLYGVASFSNKGRLMVDFLNVNHQGKTRSISLKAHDNLDGYEGLIIQDPDVVSALQKETNNQVTTEISSQGTVGRIVSSMVRKKKTQIKITLYDEHQLILNGTL